MNNNYKINEYLGAKVFKKLVFKLEKVKFKITSKVFPNLTSNYEKRLRKNLEKTLKKIDNEDERRRYIASYQENILLSRKENNSKQNRNYHINMENPTEFVKYLKRNKQIHVNGLIRNGIYYLIIIPLIVFGNPFFSIIGYTLFGWNTISTIINFECINLQNYNLKRFELSKEKIRRIKEKKQDLEIKKYGKISEIVSREFCKSDDIPKMEDIVGNITTKEELEQMKSLLLKYSNSEKPKEKKLKMGKGGVI